MYSRVKLQLFIIYTVVRILNKVLRLFVFASHVSIGLQRRQKSLGRADATDEHLTMRVRYTSGEGRGGRRRSQISVRWRFVKAVAEAIRRMSCEWHELPNGAIS